MGVWGDRLLSVEMNRPSLSSQYAQLVFVHYKDMVARQEGYLQPEMQSTNHQATRRS